MKGITCSSSSLGAPSGLSSRSGHSPPSASRSGPPSGRSGGAGSSASLCRRMGGRWQRPAVVSRVPERCNGDEPVRGARGSPSRTPRNRRGFRRSRSGSRCRRRCADPLRQRQPPGRGPTRRWRSRRCRYGSSSLERDGVFEKESSPEAPPAGSGTSDGQTR